MLFIIWVGVIIGLLLVGTLLSLPRRSKTRYVRRYWDGKYLSTFGMIALAWTVIAGLVILLGGFGPNKAENAGTPTLQDTHTLRALVTKEVEYGSGSVSFFLGIGGGSYSSGTATTIAYIQQAKDGGSTLESVSIDDSIIYEGSERPYVEDWANVWTDDGLWFPWPVTLVADYYKTYKFHIPEGTILEQYEVGL